MVTKDSGEIEITFPYLKEDDVLPVVDAAADTGVRVLSNILIVPKKKTIIIIIIIIIIIFYLFFLIANCCKNY
jgi:hypothetical protein